MTEGTNPENAGPSQGLGPVPPQQPWAYAGQQGVQPPRSMGVMLVLVAVGCLLFSLGCGCIDAWWSASLFALRSGTMTDEVLKVQIQSQFENAKNEALKRANTEEERERIIRGFDVLLRESVPEAAGRGVTEATKHPAAARLQILGVLSVAAQVAMFVTGILLFLRRGAAKWVGIVACVLIIGLNAATALAMQEVVGAFTAEILPVLEQAARESGQALDSEVASVPQAVRMGVTVFTLVSALLMSLWPLTCALILALSRGIARDLGIAPVRTM